jgi:hypothetical protein
MNGIMYAWLKASANDNDVEPRRVNDVRCMMSNREWYRHLGSMYETMDGGSLDSISLVTSTPDCPNQHLPNAFIALGPVRCKGDVAKYIRGIYETMDGGRRVTTTPDSFIALGPVTCKEGVLK